MEDTNEGFAIILKRGGKWFTVTDEDDFIHQFESKREAKKFAQNNPLCATAQALSVIDLNIMAEVWV